MVVVGSVVVVVPDTGVVVGSPVTLSGSSWIYRSPVVVGSPVVVVGSSSWIVVGSPVV